MLNEFSRSEMLLGTKALETLKNSSVLVFGIGGVGSYAVEALVRGGIGKIGLVDYDKVSVTNINRQLVATQSTVGMFKTDVAKAHILDVNPMCEVEIYPCFYGRDTENDVPLGKYDYLVDAIDSVTSKILLIENAQKLNIPIISSMGTGNKLDPTKLKVTDIYKTEMCPLARVMRYELRKRGIKKLKTVYSTEQAIKPAGEEKSPGSVPFVPSVAGLIIAGEVIKDLIAGKRAEE